MENEIYLSGGFFFSLLTEKKSLNRPQRDILNVINFDIFK